MQALQGEDYETDMAIEFQAADLDSVQNPPKQNIEIFEQDANNSFTMHLGILLTNIGNNNIRW